MELKQGHMKMVSKLCLQKFRLGNISSFFFKYLNNMTIQQKKSLGSQLTNGEWI